MSTIDYNLNIPNGPNNPSNDWSDMQVNTNSNATIWSSDHFTFGTGLDGTHAKSVYQAANISPGTGNPTTNANQGALFTQSTASVVNLYYRFQNSGAIVQLTSNVTPSAMANGVTFLPGGIIVQWGHYEPGSGNFSTGSTTSSSGGQSVITFPVPFPTNVFFFGGNLTYTNSNLPSGTGTLNARLSQLNSGSKTTMDWQVYCNTNNYIGFIWYAIGN